MVTLIAVALVVGKDANSDPYPIPTPPVSILIHFLPSSHSLITVNVNVVT